MAAVENVESHVPINVTEFLCSWVDFLVEDDIVGYPESPATSIGSALGVGQEVVAELEDVCGLSTLHCEGEPQLSNGAIPTVNDLNRNVPEDSDLSSVKINKANKEQQAENMVYKKAIKSRMKYRTNTEPLTHAKLNCLPEYEDTVELPEVLLNVRIYHPYNRQYVGLSKLKLMQEFQVLGCQKLTHLRDVIRCRNDDLPINDMSDCPDIQPDLAKDVYKSGFFYIENTFYNDMRDPTNIDYSSTILKWAAEKKDALSKCCTQDMDAINFSNLTIRIGHPYLYMHQGNCEHLLVFSNLRLLHSSDCKSAEQYPLLVSHMRPRQATCRCCLNNPVVWQVNDSMLCPENPCMLCDTCFRRLHYDTNGVKLLEFQAYKLPP